MTAIELAKNGIRISERVGNEENKKVWQEILDALEKDTSKEPKVNELGEYVCPTCGCVLLERCRCSNNECGQKIDWAFKFRKWKG